MVKEVAEERGEVVKPTTSTTGMSNTHVRYCGHHVEGI